MGPIDPIEIEVCEFNIILSAFELNTSLSEFKITWLPSYVWTFWGGCELTVGLFVIGVIKGIAWLEVK